MPRAKRPYRYDLHALYTQNFLGAKSDTAVAEHLGTCKLRATFAVCGQETWRAGTDAITQDGLTFVGVGPARQDGRGSAGVSITLSHLASSAWDRANREKHDDLGSRLLGIRLEV
eukprot:CAMPEP_0183378176 /NCGR_PEP_ID=MMETSP0164_2-20130417/124779_1 /TAXON_ID=221442 /ORGANISM="Coccolithus pelagicus ssp braarudi, Strain PLY182g" /LENGTH=114 /DNA_ID=CAMNT_0025555723 /DNA_START=505 /DNA_END=845 /DNA_ORIENTATION=+